MKRLRIACIIPTYNGRNDLVRLLDSLQAQTASFDTFVVDSSSTDGTREVALARVGQVTVIDPSEFNHGATRQSMVDGNPGYDAYVFLTQDAYLNDQDAIAEIVKPLAAPNVGAVCGRQLPHLDASPVAQHARFFSYSPDAQIKTVADIPKLGIKTAFMSNSFAAYKSEALRAVGGFPANVIFAEDMYTTAKMLLAGWEVAYAGNAVCRHSHNYSILEEFKRYFDMGVFHTRETWIRKAVGGAGSEGIRYVTSELRFLGLGRSYLWPSVFVRNAFKLAGYKLGQQEARLPISLKRSLSMHKRYWDGLPVNSNMADHEKI